MWIILSKIENFVSNATGEIFPNEVEVTLPQAHCGHACKVCVCLIVQREAAVLSQLVPGWWIPEFILIVAIKFFQNPNFILLKIDSALMNLINSQSDGQQTKDRKVGDLSSAEDVEDLGDEDEDKKKKKKKKKKTSTKKTKVVEESASKSTPGSAHSATTTPGKEKSKDSPVEVNGITFIGIKFLW